MWRVGKNYSLGINISISYPIPNSKTWKHTCMYHTQVVGGGGCSIFEEKKRKKEMM